MTPGPKVNDSLEIRACLDRILASVEFERAGRIRLLLQFLVEMVLEGRAGELKESVVGMQVFERDASYDPKIDPVVRVTASRLRTKLEQYYQREGRSDSIRIDIPKGSYVPSFSRIQTPSPEPQPPAAVRRIPRAAWWEAVGMAGL